MRTIEDSRVTRVDNVFNCVCVSCNSKNSYTTKDIALKSLARGTCKACKKDYRAVRDQDENSALGIYKNAEGLWCSSCSGCGKEQAYTRRDHAKNSSRGDWKCKTCATYENKVRPSFYKEFRLTDIESFEKNAVSRGLCWKLDADTVPTLWAEQDGKCNLSGITLVKYPRTWSIDRIDSSRGYEPDNVQLVDKRINMAKGAMDQEEFISLCISVANTHKEKW
jgi:hypothetical protein